jgi:hypothetical protein
LEEGVIVNLKIILPHLPSYSSLETHLLLRAPIYEGLYAFALHHDFLGKKLYIYNNYKPVLSQLYKAIIIWVLLLSSYQGSFVRTWGKATASLSMMLMIVTSNIFSIYP